MKDYTHHTPEYFNSILNYDHAIGILYWKRETKNTKIGQRAGLISSRYPKIKVDGKTYSCHRLVWFMYYGYWPREIDHINGDKKDFRLSNLRESSRSGNMHNRPRTRRNKTGYKGVSYCKKYQYYQASISVNGTAMFLGYRSTPEEAYKLYKEASLKYYGEYTSEK